MPQSRRNLRNREINVRYVIMAVAGVFALVGWLNSPSGHQTKVNLLSPHHAQTVPVE